MSSATPFSTSLFRSFVLSILLIPSNVLFIPGIILFISDWLPVLHLHFLGFFYLFVKVLPEFICHFPNFLEYCYNQCFELCICYICCFHFGEFFFWSLVLFFHVGHASLCPHFGCLPASVSMY
uniref:Uncharacterized protein n=1 Tax=Rousettus aegyptiacus TaxID=9407 RepID=A0A7J8C2G4_ROUAE|nr:hypothetical protein HJG63_009340 [Rousettus aegyptiacus]